MSQVPQDISVAGFGDDLLASIYRPVLLQFKNLIVDMELLFQWESWLKNWEMRKVKRSYDFWFQELLKEVQLQLLNKIKFNNLKPTAGRFLSFFIFS